MAKLARDVVATTPVRTGVDALYVATALIVEAPVVFTWDDRLQAVRYEAVEGAEPPGAVAHRSATPPGLAIHPLQPLGMCPVVLDLLDKSRVVEEPGLVGGHDGRGGEDDRAIRFCMREIALVGLYAGSTEADAAAIVGLNDGVVRLRGC